MMMLLFGTLVAITSQILRLRLAGRLTMSGTHEGPLMGTPPTERSVRQDHMHFVRFRDGKAVEHWGVRDDLGMMQQLGVMPEPGQAGEPGPM